MYHSTSSVCVPSMVCACAEYIGSAEPRWIDVILVALTVKVFDYYYYGFFIVVNVSGKNHCHRIFQGCSTGAREPRELVSERVAVRVPTTC